MPKQANKQTFAKNVSLARSSTGLMLSVRNEASVGATRSSEGLALKHGRPLDVGIPLAGVSRRVRDEDLAEDERDRLVAGVKDAVHAQTPELATAVKVEVAHTEAGRHHPDVRERHARELAAPDERQRHCADERRASVAAALPGAETAECVAPYAVS